MKTRYVGEDERFEMRRLRAEERWTRFAIAVHFDRAVSTVYDHTHDIPPPEGGWHFGCPRKHDYARIRALLDQGLKFKQVAHRVGCGMATITRAVNDSSRSKRRAVPQSHPKPPAPRIEPVEAAKVEPVSVSAKKLGRPPAHDPQYILLLISKGVSREAIAERLGCGMSTVLRAIRSEQRRAA